MVDSAGMLNDEESFGQIKNFADKILAKITSENKFLIFPEYKVTVGEIAAQILAADALRTKRGAKSSSDLNAYFAFHSEKIEDIMNGLKPGAVHKHDVMNGDKYPLPYKSNWRIESNKISVHRVCVGKFSGQIEGVFNPKKMPSNPNAVQKLSDMLEIAARKLPFKYRHSLKYTALIYEAKSYESGYGIVHAEVPVGNGHVLNVNRHYNDINHARDKQYNSYVESIVDAARMGIDNLERLDDSLIEMRQKVEGRLQKTTGIKIRNITVESVTCVGSKSSAEISINMKINFKLVGNSLQEISKWTMVRLVEDKPQPEPFLDDITASHKRNQKAVKRNIDNNTPGVIFADSVAAGLIKGCDHDIKEITLDLIAKEHAGLNLYQSKHSYKIERANGDLTIVLEHGIIKAYGRLTEYRQKPKVSWDKRMLVIEGVKMPSIMVMSLKGKTMTSVVDHPALDGVEIKHAGNNNGKLTLSAMEKINPIDLS